MPKARYYEPGVIKPHPRVKHKRLNGQADLYVGEAADLIEAGIIQEHMLPPRISISWRPAGVQQLKGEWINDLPGYVTITRRPEGGFGATLKVSREERAARKEAARRREAEWASKFEGAREEERRRYERAREEGKRAYLSDPEELRSESQHYLRRLAWQIANHTEGDHERTDDPTFYCRFDPDALEDVWDALCEVERWLKDVEIRRLDKTGEHIQAARKDKGFQAFLQSQCLLK